MDYLKKFWHILACVVGIAVLGGVYFFGGSSNSDVQHRVIAPAVDHEAEAGSVFHGSAPTSPNGTEPSMNTPPPSNVPPSEPPEIVVHIEGAVAQPGVFTLPYGSRVNDVLTKAGGPTEEADLARINLAAFLQDAQQVIIPAEGDETIYTPYWISAQEEITSTEDVASDGTARRLININTATEAELRTLPGVGQVIAGNIIAHRTANGYFTTIEELRNVPRIGAVTMDNLRNLITVE